MTSRVSMALLIVFASFSVQCVQDSAWQGGAPGDRRAGPVARAAAQTSPGDPSDVTSGPTILFDEVVTPTPVAGACLSREIDISDYRSVVVHRPIETSTELKFGDAAGFVRLFPATTPSFIQVIDTQLGRLLRFSWGVRLGGFCDPRAFTVVGHRDAAITPPT